MDRHDEAKRHYSQFCEHAEKCLRGRRHKLWQVQQNSTHKWNDRKYFKVRRPKMPHNK